MSKCIVKCTLKINDLSSKIMPELPEIETTLRGIKPHLTNNKIQHSVIYNNQLRWPIAKEILHISNEKILNVQRRAKYLLIQLQHGWIIIHLGMSGNLRVLTKNKLAEKHDHVDLFLTNGKILRYTDPRRFGAWLWTRNLDTFFLFLNLGPEPLSNNFNTNYLHQQIKNKKIPIKIVLMNSKIVVGLGNIYANEVLFAAKILPTRASFSLTKKEIDYLVICIKQILQYSIKLGGTTIKNFSQPDGKPGYFSNKLSVYGRDGKICSNCSQLIKSIKLRKRNTYFCCNCQK